MARGRKRNTQEKIISQFKAAHGDRYDYSSVNYQTVHEKVTIICREHGPFEQNPKKHRSGAVCPGCVSIRIKTTCMARYGVDNHAKTDIARAHNAAHMKRQSANGILKQGMIRKFGADNPLGVPEIKAKVQNTMLKKHGVLNPFQLNVRARVNKATQTKIATGRILDPSLYSAFVKYRKEVWRLTESNIKDQGAHWLQRKRSRKLHVDHIYSIHDGFLNFVAPDVIASICNLQLLPGPINISKNSDSWMTLEDLLLTIAASDSSKVLCLQSNT